MKGFWGYKTPDGYDVGTEDSINGIGVVSGMEHVLWCDECKGKGSVACPNLSKHDKYDEDHPCPKCDEWPGSDGDPTVTCPVCGGGDIDLAKGHYRALKSRPDPWTAYGGRHRASS